MLNFLKKIFQNEGQEGKKEVEISLQELEEWFKEKSKPMMENIRQQTESMLMRIAEEVQRARYSIEILENAKLQNPNIPFKAKQYMEGNRKAYIRAVNSFLGHLEINNKDYYYLLDFCKLFDEMINDLNKGTLRSYTILQEFFANETGRIAQNLKNFDVLFKELKSTLNNKNMVEINNAIENVQRLEARRKQKINLDMDLKSAEAAFMIANNEKDSLMADIEKFNKSDEHKNFISLNEQKKTKAREFYNDENRILQSFAVLERPLRKYSHVAFEHEELVLDYLKQTIDTLVNDKELKIVEILKSMEKSLKDGKINVDERKREKSIEEISKLDREFLEQFTKKYFSFKSEMGELDKRIDATGVAEKLRMLNKQLEEANIRIEKNNEEFSKLKNESAKAMASLESLKAEIENSAMEIFNEAVRIAI